MSIFPSLTQLILVSRMLSSKRGAKLSPLLYLISKVFSSFLIHFFPVMHLTKQTLMHTIDRKSGNLLLFDFHKKNIKLIYFCRFKFQQVILKRKLRRKFGLSDRIFFSQSRNCLIRVTILTRFSSILRYLKVLRMMHNYVFFFNL